MITIMYVTLLSSSLVVSPDFIAKLESSSMIGLSFDWIVNSVKNWYSDICAKRHLRERHLREVERD